MPDDASTPHLSRHAHVSAAGLATLLGAAAVTHFARPRVYEPLIPRPLGNPRAWVLASGAAELLCAAAVALPPTRRIGALASAALFVVVFPGNVQMALDAGPFATNRRRFVIAWARLPLQAPLIAWALAVASRSARAIR
ncbi:MAG: hypothetical protein ACOH2F_15920 [Cellulomonas sp.]